MLVEGFIHKNRFVGLVRGTSKKLGAIGWKSLNGWEFLGGELELGKLDG